MKFNKLHNLIENEDIVKKVQDQILKEHDLVSWEEFVDGCSMGECQFIAQMIPKDFPQIQSKFGEIEVDDEYIDEDGEEQKLMTHHWNELNGEILDFSKGTLTDYIDWTDKYEVYVSTDSWRYNAIR